MRKIIIIFLIFTTYLNSQVLDTLAVVRVNNILPISPNEIEFELEFLRESNKWERITNATFHLEFQEDEFTPEIQDIKPENFHIEYIDGSSDFNVLHVEQESDLAFRIDDTYLIHDTIHDGRISVYFLGPDSVGSNKLIPNNLELEADTAIKVGRFRLFSNDPLIRVPTILSWIQPYNKFQATSFKLIDGRDLYDVFGYYERNDNVELNNPRELNTVFFENDTTHPPFRFKYVDAQYIGEGRIRVNWATYNEIFTSGFIVERIRTGPLSSSMERNSLNWWSELDESIYIDPSDDNIPNPDIDIVGVGIDKVPFTTYSEFRENSNLDQPDDVNYTYGNDYFYIDTIDNFEDLRGSYFCYQVSYVDWNDNIIPLGISCEVIPNAIITYASAKPNPFVDRTTVEYTLEDNCSLTAAVYDVSGKKVLDLINEPNMRRGQYSVDVNMPHLSAQGLYNLIFYATPLDDNSIVGSKALVKLQLLR